MSCLTNTPFGEINRIKEEMPNECKKATQDFYSRLANELILTNTKEEEK